MIDRIQAWLQKPMIEQTPKDEIIGCLIIFGVLALIWLTGEIVYLAEKRGENNDKKGT